MNFNASALLNGVNKGAKSVVAFSKKNLPSIMIGGSIIGFWGALVLIAKKAPEAKEELLKEEEKRKVEGQEPVSKKEAALIYAKHCWAPAAIGAVATGLAMGAHKIDLQRIGEMYMLSQFYKDDGEKLKKAITNRKDGEKIMNEAKHDIHREENPPEQIEKDYLNGDIPGTGTVLLIDRVTGVRWKDNIMNVMNGIAEFDAHMSKKFEGLKSDAFYSGGSPHEFDEFVAESLERFLEMIGESNYPLWDRKMSDLLEFRAYSSEPLLKPKQILDYQNFQDPDTGAPVICYLDYSEYLAPSSELLERYPGLN